MNSFRAWLWRVAGVVVGGCLGAGLGLWLSGGRSASFAILGMGVLGAMLGGRTADEMAECPNTPFYTGLLRAVCGSGGAVTAFVRLLLLLAVLIVLGGFALGSRAAS